MSGTILIVDPAATNRIILKSSLLAAFFRVLTATSLAEARDLLWYETPDLVIANTAMNSAHSGNIVLALKTLFAGSAPPVIAVLPNNEARARCAALGAGADDVITARIDPAALLARVGCLMRHQQAEQDQALETRAAHATGFAEAKAEFAGPGAAVGDILPSDNTLTSKIALVCSSGCEDGSIAAKLGISPGDQLACVSAAQAMDLVRGDTPPDLFVVTSKHEEGNDMLRLIANLKAAPRTRRLPVLAFVNDVNSPQAARVLEIGAADTLSHAMDPQEIEHRLTRQLRQKRADDRLHSQLHRGLSAAITDPLTGLHNRRYALPAAAKMASEALGNGRDLAVMIADIDHFKSINDHFGHATGDTVLQQVASQLRTCVGEAGMIARIGGEEFLIALPVRDADEALAHAGRIRRAMHAVQTPSRNTGGVTVSIGLTMASAHSQPHQVNELLDDADRALYAAKARGRDTVTFRKPTAA